jgi:hypothetical protein
MAGRTIAARHRASNAAVRSSSFTTASTSFTG